MHDTPRIGIDARFWAREHGGLSTYTQALLRYLAAADQRTEYRVFIRTEDLPDWDIHQPNFHAVPVDIGHYSPEEQTRFAGILWNERLDLVHFLNFNHPLLYRRPYVTTLHDLTVYYRPTGRSQRSWIRRQAFKAVLRHGLLGAQRVIAISEFSAQDAEMKLGLLPTKVDVVYEGTEAALELPFGNRAIVQEYLGTREPYFLFVSQWRPHKGIVTLAEAFATFKQQTGLPHRLVLAGRQKSVEPEILAALDASPAAADIIRPGFVPDGMLPSLYKNAAAFVMPSEYEGFGLPVLEALRYGAAVIAADNSSLPEVGGNAALYFPTGDSEVLASLLADIVQDKGLGEGLRGKAAAQLAKFSWDRCAKQTLDVYRHVLEKHAGSATL